MGTNSGHVINTKPKKFLNTRSCFHECLCFEVTSTGDWKHRLFCSSANSKTCGVWCIAVLHQSSPGKVYCINTMQNRPIAQIKYLKRCNVCCKIGNQLHRNNYLLRLRAYNAETAHSVLSGAVQFCKETAAAKFFSIFRYNLFHR